MLKQCLLRLKELHKFCKKNKKASFGKKDLMDIVIMCYLTIKSG